MKLLVRNKGEFIHFLTEQFINNVKNHTEDELKSELKLIEERNDYPIKYPCVSVIDYMAYTKPNGVIDLVSVIEHVYQEDF